MKSNLIQSELSQDKLGITNHQNLFKHNKPTPSQMKEASFNQQFTQHLLLEQLTLITIWTRCPAVIHIMSSCYTNRQLRRIMLGVHNSAHGNYAAQARCA